MWPFRAESSFEAKERETAIATETIRAKMIALNKRCRAPRADYLEVKKSSIGTIPVCLESLLMAVDALERRIAELEKK